MIIRSDKIEERQVEYPDIEVRPLQFSASELKASHWKFLMGAVGNQATYIRQIMRIMKAMRDESVTKGFETEASTVLKSMPGELSAKGALLRAVSEIKDENVRKAAQTILAAGANAFEELLTAKGSGKPGDKPADAEAAFEKGVKDYMKAESIKSDISGRAAFMKTDEGKVLYKAYAEEQHLKSKAA